MNDPVRDLLLATAEHASSYLASLGDRPVAAALDAPAALDRIDPTLADGPIAARDVVDELVAQIEPGITAMGSPRYFGFVIGGALPSAIAADWLVSAWDQNAGLASPTPAAAAAEEITGGWLLELLRLPPSASFAFVTGCQMAHVTALAAARHRVLADAGWDVERDGLVGAPPVRVLAGGERHVTIDRALRFLGFGTACIESVDVDGDGAMRAERLAEQLAAGSGPTIVCAQAGNVNTGSVDPLGAICDAAHAVGAWVHVDGAFGLWANASPRYRALLDGCERADSWATDGHKWLNVPYDCGLAFVADRDAHRAAMSVSASYLQQGEPVREPLDWTPEFSRRARALPVYAALRSLGRSGVAELVERLCGCAERFAARLDALPDIDVLSQGLNQVLVRLHPDPDVTDRIVHELQQDGTFWASATTWHDQRCLRISVSNWRTMSDDVDRSVAALTRIRDDVMSAG